LLASDTSRREQTGRRAPPGELVRLTRPMHTSQVMPSQAQGRSSYSAPRSASRCGHPWRRAAAGVVVEREKRVPGVFLNERGNGRRDICHVRADWAPEWLACVAPTHMQKWQSFC
jgi:hypothetical protein